MHDLVESCPRPLNVLIIDHYDSYTNNILQLLCGSTSDQRPRWIPRIIKFDTYDWSTFQSTILPFCDAIILSPGPGRSDRSSDFGFNAKLIRSASIPILGICLGHQGIGTAFGASVVHAPNIRHGQVSHIRHNGSGVLSGLPQVFEGVLYNSLVVDENSLPQEIIATAWAVDAVYQGKRVLMGLRCRDRPVFGVQWHPESTCSKHGQRIMDNFYTTVVDHLKRDSLESRSILAHSQSHAFLQLPPLIPSAKAQKTSDGVRTSNTYGDKESQCRVVAEAIGPGPEPAVIFDNFIRGKSEDGEVWLDSAKTLIPNSGYSYLAFGVYSIAYWTRTRRLVCRQQGKILSTHRLTEGFWTWLDQTQGEIQQQLLTQTTTGNSEVSKLQVGFLGYFGYELKRESLAGYRGVLESGPESKSKPDAQLIFASTVLRYDHKRHSWTAFGLIRDTEYDTISTILQAKLPVAVDQRAFKQHIARLKLAFANSTTATTAPATSIVSLRSRTPVQSYKRAIALAKLSIREGESYEMTLTTKFHGILKSTSPFSHYLTLRTRNPAPYSAYLNFPASKTAILSSSPERFISLNSAGSAEMKPIKGTVAVSEDPYVDQQRKQYLSTDVKERAENLMIVDLIRADLHNIAPPESITVPKLLHVESFEKVHQLVTTIRAQVCRSVGAVAALRLIFPPGSMTGAPKLRSVQILDELEQGRERGAYSGCLGYLCVSGAMDMSVVIRTLVVTGEDVELGAGGAVTWLSDAEQEWEEVLVKARSVAEVLVEVDEQKRADDQRLQEHEAAERRECFEPVAEGLLQGKD